MRTRHRTSISSGRKEIESSRAGPNSYPPTKISSNLNLPERQMTLIMGNYTEFLRNLTERLSKDGFSVSRDIMSKPEYKADPKYNLEFVATRTQLSVLRNSWTHVILATTSDIASQDTVREFSNYGWIFSLFNKTRLVQASPNQISRVRLAVVPVIVSESFTDDVRDWIVNNSPPSHGGDQFEFPVLLATGQKKIYYSQKSSIWGRAYIKGVRELVEKHLGF